MYENVSSPSNFTELILNAGFDPATVEFGPSLFPSIPGLPEAAAAVIAEHFRDLQFDTVLGYKADGGIFGNEIAKLTGKRFVLAPYTTGIGYDIEPLLAGRKLLVVTVRLDPDNTLHRSGFGYIIESAAQCGAEIAASAAMWKIQPPGNCPMPHDEEWRAVTAGTFCMNELQSPDWHPRMDDGWVLDRKGNALFYAPELTKYCLAESSAS